MSAYKKFNQQDVFVSEHTARKSWFVTGSLLDDYGIQLIAAESSSTEQYYLTESDLFSGSADSSAYYKPLVYRSINQLYYSLFTSGSIVSSGSFDNHLESSFVQDTRNLRTYATVFSLPRNIVGTHIEPGSITITPPVFGATSLYITGGYVQDEITFEDFYFVNNVIPYYNSSGEIRDNGDGVLYIVTGSGTLNVGNVIYSHGLMIVTDDTVASYYNSKLFPSVEWKSNYPIYTYNFNCKLRDSEFNVTLNPTALSGSDGTVANNVTGSEFQPYLTTVGLYNDSNELIAVGKFAQPIPKSADTEMTVVVKLDI